MGIGPAPASQKLMDRLGLTGVGCVTRVYTSLAVVDVQDGHFVLREKLSSISMDELQSLTGATLHVNGGMAMI